MEAVLQSFYEICEGLSLAYIVLGVATLFFAVAFLLNFYIFASDKLNYLLRWLRFYLLSSYSYLLLTTAFGLGANIYSVLLAIIIVVWVELSYIYLKACSYSKRNVLPFSCFVECENAWRPSRTYCNLKKRIEELGFVRIESLKSTNTLSLMTIFYNEKENVALFVSFKIYKDRLCSVLYFISKKESGTYLIYTNDFSDDVLFLKGEYSLHYRCLSFLKGLFLKHRARMKYDYETFVDFKDEATDLHNKLYHDNLMRGVQNGIYKDDRQDGELLGAEGKFQFCKKVIIKNYFRL